jgi:serralysin
MVGPRGDVQLPAGGDDDVLDLGVYATDVQIDLNPGVWTVTSTDQLADLDSAHPGTYLALGNIYNPLAVDRDPRSLIENAVGGSGNDVVIGNIANNYLFGQDGDDRLVGNDGDDWLRGDQGNDVVQGGNGFDTTLYWNEVKFFTITAQAGTLTVLDRSGVDGTDSVSSIEQFYFAGIDTGIDSNWLADASRLDPAHFADLVSLYIAYFDRAPDALGLD